MVELRNDTGDVVRHVALQAAGCRCAGPGRALIAGQSTVAIEELEIAHEGLIVQTLGAVSEIAETIGALGGR